MKKKPFIVEVTYQTVVNGANDEEQAEQFAKAHASQVLGRSIKVSVNCLPDDKEPCSYGKLNRTCDGTKCKECEREDILQAMNEDASDERHGLFERDND